LYHNEYIITTYRHEMSQGEKLCCRNARHVCVLIELIVIHSIRKARASTRAFLFTINTTKMSFIIINHTIQKHLIRSFAVLDGWFDSDADVLNFQVEGEPTIAGLMKSIVLNNHHLLQIPNVDDAGREKSGLPYNLDLAELEHAARHWRCPPEEEGHINLEELRACLRVQLETSLLMLDRAEIDSSDTFHPLACAEPGSWDGFHRLYFMGLVMRQYTRRFRQIAEQYESLIVR
jgi:hypothetical protein